MKRKVKSLPAGWISDESGHALILVLLFLLLGSLMLVPALDHLNTALKTGMRYEDKTEALYAADAGIEDGIWQIKYNGLKPKFGGEENYNYDFTTNASYLLEDPVNGLTTNVTINNIWIPSNITLDELGLSASEAQSIIESDKLIVSGTSGASPGEPYHIMIQFDPDTGDNLTIKSVGVWLPQGFSYVPESCDLDDPENADEEYYRYSVSTSPHCGGEATVWSYTSPYPLFTSFPNFISQSGNLTSTIEFSYESPSSDPTKMPAGIAWVTTEMTDSLGCPKANDVPISWDVDTRIYKITSAAGGTSIEAYSSKLELRDLNEAIAGDYVAIGNSLMTDDNSDHIKDHWHSSSYTTLTDNPSNADVIYAFLYWSGFRYDNTVFSDTCTSTNFTGSWTNGGDWSYSSYRYQGQHTGASDDTRYLTINNGVDLGSYPSGTEYEVSWSQSVVSLSDVFSDTCSNSNLSNYWVNGGDWSYDNNNPKYYKGQHSGTDDATRYLTLASGQDLNGCSAATVSWNQWKSGTLDSGDYLYFYLSSDNGTTWSSNFTAGSSANLTDWATAFTYTIPAEYLTNGFKARYYIAGFGSGKYCNIDNIEITPQYSASDGLDFAFYDGSNWGSNIQAFRGPDNPASSFSYAIPSEYINSNFKMRFYLVGMGGSQQYCRLDNIKIIVRAPDTSITFSIDDEQVYLDGNGDPQSGSQPLMASDASILINESWGGFSYACHRDVSKLVIKYPVVPEEQHHTGNAKYTIGDVQADPGEHVSYAGWSLIIIYFSQETAGHYLYLYDVFSLNPQYTNMDFDYDGEPGGEITDFVIPEPIRDNEGNITETVAAKLTCFVGEGDDWLWGSIPNTDCVKITGQQSEQSKYLSNNVSPDYNVWNSASPGMSYEGVDIDTFEILWNDNILTPNDIRLHLDMYSGQDFWNLIYFILSVRSKTVIGGTEHYIIRD
jgi:hypothetical protein